ncbi:hypothetical protein Esti_004787 [Eimeria stiedai]
MCDQLAMKFYRTGTREYVRAYVETCARCRASKAVCQKPAGLLQPLTIPSRRWSSTSLDFIGGVPLSADGYGIIFTVVESLNGQTESANRIIEQMLRTYIQSREEEQPELLPALELAYSCTSHFVTGLSSFEVMLSENTPRPQDLYLVEVFSPALTHPMSRALRILVDRATVHLKRGNRDQ